MMTCLTGTILVFENELQHLFFKHRYYAVDKGTVLTADSLINRVTKKMPGVKISGIKFYADKGRTVEVSLMQTAKKNGLIYMEKEKILKQKAPEGNRLTAFVNPYSGEVLEIYNYRKSFFYFVMDLHRWMLGGDTGKMIVGICTLIFLFILITGIILWWPKNKQILKQRLKIKGDAGLKRLNHDYHIVLGFYSAIFLFVFAFTGLAWSFEWFNKGIFTVTNSSMERPKPPKNIVKDSINKISVELALQTVISQNNKAVYYNVSLPKDSTEGYAVNILSEDARHESATDTYFVDAYKPAIIGVQKFADKNRGQKLRSIFKPIHVASIYGIPSKIIGFLACLSGVFFPASGIFMWYNRTRKKRQNKMPYSAQTKMKNTLKLKFYFYFKTFCSPEFSVKVLKSSL